MVSFDFWRFVIRIRIPDRFLLFSDGYRLLLIGQCTNNMLTNELMYLLLSQSQRKPRIKWYGIPAEL